METRTKAVTAAIAGTALGAAGLVAIAMPAGAGEQPDLPAIGAEELVQSAVTSKPPAFGGTVAMDNQLGLPAIPGAEALDFASAEVHTDGGDRSRVSLSGDGSEQTIIHSKDTAWSYDSGERKATKMTVPADIAAQHDAKAQQLGDPAAIATQVLAKIRESSEVSVDGTAMVADRPAYELVLTPKPGERTLLREVRVAVDAETKMPLRLAVQTNGTTEPALEVGFTDISFGAQPEELFTFTPPEGVQVEEKQPKTGPEAADRKPADADAQIVGDGWDTVITTRVPEEMLKPQQSEDGRSVDPKALLAQFGKPVTGAFGSGHVITTKVGTALITDDGRVAAGAVPEQVLTEVLGK